ncbi:MAG: prolipoprotein diacylglyceryl transferase [Candidatus Zixiibacteriota bacterium]|nr:MAG: prolipoprotein diacylglyceryl transferase [candidate division Zixibacteria bacterium]
MYPELFHIGPIPIRSYGVMLALAFFIGVWYVRGMTKRDGKSFESFLTIAYIMIFGGVIGGRLSYVLFHLDEFSNNWSATFNPFANEQFGIAGLNLYGGILLALLGTWVYCKLKDISVLEVLDYFSPALGIGIAVGRIGCFLNGCCFGTPTELPWGISFPVGSIPYSIFGDLHLHPSQIYSSLYGLGLFILLHYLLKHRKFPGFPVGILLMVESVFRIAIEYVRYYEDAMYFSIGDISITYNYLIAISLFILGLMILIFNYKKKRI